MRQRKVTLGIQPVQTGSSVGETVIHYTRRRSTPWTRLLEAGRTLHAPTWTVAVAIYASWFALTRWHALLPLPLLFAGGGVVIAWHGSLQHETIHGHPRGPRWIGWLLGAPPLSLWLPYGVYRTTHRQHHATAHLTDPEHDPESPFLTASEWEAIGPVRRALATAQRTVLGRLLVGPPCAIARFFVTETRAVTGGAEGRRRAWIEHALLASLVLAWVIGACEMPLWKYLLAFVYPGASLTLLRSLAEHRSAPDRGRRTVVVEAGLFFRLLYLNNNLHAAHHAAPHLPWFELPRAWQEQRASFTTRSPELIRSSYAAIVREYAVKPLSPPNRSRRNP